MSLKVDKDTISGLANELKTLGFKEHDALVYVSLLKLGETGTSRIIRDAGLHGQYVYQSLERLEKMGLAQHVVKRGRKKFTAKSPQTLVHLAETKKAQAETLATRLSNLMILPPEQVFEVYQGNDAYVAHEFDALRRAQEGSELLIIGGSGDKFNESMGTRLSEYSKLQIKKNIRVRYIGSSDERKKIATMHENRENFSVRYLPGLFTGQVNINVWPDALGFNIYGDPVTRFTVFSPIIAQSYKQFFETLWRIAKGQTV